MPQVFEVVFLMSVIMWIESIGGGWGGQWGRVGSCRQAKANRNGSDVPSVGDPDWHNSNGRPGLPTESVWHPM